MALDVRLNPFWTSFFREHIVCDNVNFNQVRSLLWRGNRLDIVKNIATYVVCISLFQLGRDNFYRLVWILRVRLSLLHFIIEYTIIIRGIALDQNTGVLLRSFHFFWMTDFVSELSLHIMATANLKIFLGVGDKYHRSIKVHT